MSIKLILLLVFFAAAIIVSTVIRAFKSDNSENSLQVGEVIVDIRNLGRIKGSTTRTARTNETIFQFLNVKYAESTSGERRFKVVFHDLGILLRIIIGIFCVLGSCASSEVERCERCKTLWARMSSACSHHQTDGCRVYQGRFGGLFEFSDLYKKCESTSMS